MLLLLNGDKTMKNTKNKKYRNMPLWGDKILNYIFKFLFGILIFWALYYPLYVSEEMDIYSKISFNMLYSIISSSFAIVLSFMVIFAINRGFKFSRKGITDLNKMPDLSGLLGELIAIVLNVIAQMFGLIWILNVNIGNNSWYTFIAIYAGIKFMTRILAIGFAKILEKNILLSVAFFIIFGSALAISIMQIQKVILNDG